MLDYYKLMGLNSMKKGKSGKEKAEKQNAGKRKSRILEEAESCRVVRGSFGRDVNWPWSSTLNGLRIMVSDDIWNLQGYKKSSRVSAAGNPPLSEKRAFCKIGVWLYSFYQGLNLLNQKAPDEKMKQSGTA